MARNVDQLKFMSAAVASYFHHVVIPRITFFKLILRNKWTINGRQAEIYCDRKLCPENPEPQNRKNWNFY